MDGPDIRVTPERPSEKKQSPEVTVDPALVVNPIPGLETLPFDCFTNRLPQVDNCPVCQHVPIAPRQLSPCGHFLCELCWIRLFQHDAYDAQCPMCRQEITTTEANADLEFKCRMLYSEAVYKKKLDENRELVVLAVLEPAAARPPASVLLREQELAQEAYQQQLTAYERAKLKLKRLRWAAYSTPVVVTLCALALVALSSGWQRWVTCVLITAGWWFHKLEHFLPKELEELRQVPYPERSRVFTSHASSGRAQPMRRGGRVIRSQNLRTRAHPAPQMIPIGEGEPWPMNANYIGAGEEDSD
jgi:hypothetical protein